MQKSDLKIPAPALDEVQLRGSLRKLRQQVPNELSLNPIARMGFDLSKRLEATDLSLDELRSIAGRLMDAACVRRAKRLRERVEFESDDATVRRFSDLVRSTIKKDGNSLEAFQAHWSRPRCGIVFTAHPTFGLSDELCEKMLEIAVSTADEEDFSFDGIAHRPDDPIDLQYEHDRGQKVIHNLRDSYVELLERFFEIAEKEYGEKWKTLRPAFATVASWIGYDLDGRTDIYWLGSFQIRLREKRNALHDVRNRFVGISKHLSDEGEILKTTRAIIGKLDLAIAAIDEQIKAVNDVIPDIEKLPQAANVITRQDSYNITSTRKLVDLFDNLIGLIDDAGLQWKIAAIRSLTSNFGLGISHIHIRVNATQLNNAFRAVIDEPWTRDLNERVTLRRITELIKNVKPAKVNFGSIELEAATAIRQFALMAQIAKHVDEETPIRFLIAECESPATILIAVYFAKLFDVEQIIDISPLFETPVGLETGARLMEQLLREETYCGYVKKRGRLCIQTGFSDAGRFIGQIAATLAIEWVHLKLADAVKTAGLKDVETLIFSTHGESMGRGAHPGNLTSRLRYVMSDEARRAFYDRGLPVKHETSFQGGDGFLIFGNKLLSKCSLTAIISDSMTPPDGSDPFYDDTNLSLDFFLRLTSYQQNIFQHSGYRATLGAFGTNLLFKTGSRAVKRQLDYFSAADRGDPARMRAIPNNAILQQLGYTANVVSGLGTAVASERERFMSIAGSSKRLRSLLEMVATAKRVSSLNAMAANASVFDAGFWTSRAYNGQEPKLNSVYRMLAEHLLPDERMTAIQRLVHQLRMDALDLHSILDETDLDAGKDPDDDRLELDLLQAIRLAAIMHIFILAGKMPRFSTQNDFSHGQLISEVISLDVPHAISVMRETFPTQQTAQQSEEYSELATYRPRGLDDYSRVESEFIQPIEETYEFVREIGTGISHHFGAFG